MKTSFFNRYSAAASNFHVSTYLLRQKHQTDMLQKDRKFCYNLMVMGKTHQNKSIEDFVFFSPAPCYTAANLSALYRDSALKEKDRGEFVYIFNSLFTYIFLKSHVSPHSC